MDLRKGDRVAMLLTNCIDAVTFDEAALGNGLVPVPLHAIDTAGSSAYILRDSNARFLVTTSRARWNAIAKAAALEQDGLPDLNLVVFTNEFVTEGSPQDVEGHPVTLLGLEEWLSTGNHVPETALPEPPAAEDIAGFIYTSGTTGRPKGVMLTHRNIVENVKQINRCFDFSHEDLFLSYLPFSHTFERTVAHYNSLANGSAMAFARSAASIEQDMLTVQPTLMCSVPRVYERIYQRLAHELAEASEEKRHLTAWTKEVGWRRFCVINDLPVEHSQRENLDETVWPTLDTDIASKIRALFGGRLRATFAGGASLNMAVAKFFCSMGINILQLYGLTETSPIVSFTRPIGNHPSCVGWPVPDCEVKLGEHDELLVRGPQVMKGYWGKPRETEAAF
ncbi:long-chain-fatty-acid--CoA ligase, partial [gut metagenome]